VNALGKPVFVLITASAWNFEMAGSFLEEELWANVRRLILATDPSSPRTGKADEDLIVDIDLRILGAPKPDYNAYCLAVRKEYSFVDDASFGRGRALILRRFFEGEIDATRSFKGLEQAARLNLEMEIRKLESFLDCGLLTIGVE
jgi:predicted metal-dependent HD superfamily phosphohydrolase